MTNAWQYAPQWAVDRPEVISRGDWVRLAFCDSRGDSAVLPYGREFLSDFERETCYDRFWDPEAGKYTRYLLTETHSSSPASAYRKAPTRT
jgi:hypothetical protein